MLWLCSRLRFREDYGSSLNISIKMLIQDIRIRFSIVCFVIEQFLEDISDYHFIYTLCCTLSSTADECGRQKFKQVVALTEASRG